MSKGSSETNTKEHNALLEEYKTLRQEILEIDKRKNNLIVYTVLVTTTLFGFALSNQSAFMFLLPLIVIIPLGYKVLELQESILHIGTYISVAIENKIDELQWETYYKEQRKKRAEKGEKLLRQLPNYLLFTSLGFLCISISIVYAFTVDSNLSSFIANIITESGQQLLTIVLLILLWVVATYFLVKWTVQMRECFGAKNQNDLEEKIKQIINVETKNESETD